MISWNEARLIASEEEMSGVRGNKTIQNWKSGDPDEKKVPASALSKFLVRWWRDERRPYIESLIAESIREYEARLTTIRRALG